MNEKKLFKLIGALIVILLCIMVYVIFTRTASSPARNVTSFEECMKAGYPVAESHPRQCHAPDNKNFVEDIRASMTIVGEIDCLPKKSDGPHTLECAIGVKMKDNKYYALKNLEKHDPEHKFSSTGQQVEVTGLLQSASKDSPYDIAGTLDVTAIKEIE